MARELSQEKRENLMSAALKLFVANGVAHTSTAEIAKAAGTAAGTLFLYFPTKQDLIHALVLKIAKDQSDYIKALLDPSLSAHDAFATIWHGSVRWFLEHMDAYRYAQQVRDTGMIDPSVALETGKYFTFYYEAIQKGLQEGSIKPYDVDIIGGILYQDIVGVMNIILGYTDPARQEEVTRLVFDIFWDGIKR
jgi:AcrR family transcriptional regulator